MSEALKFKFYCFLQYIDDMPDKDVVVLLMAAGLFFLSWWSEW